MNTTVNLRPASRRPGRPRVRATPESARGLRAEGLSVRAIARQLGVSVGTASSLIAGPDRPRDAFQDGATAFEDPQRHPGNANGQSAPIEPPPAAIEPERADSISAAQQDALPDQVAADPSCAGSASFVGGCKDVAPPHLFRRRSPAPGYTADGNPAGPEAPNRQPATLTSGPAGPLDVFINPGNAPVAILEHLGDGTGHPSAESPSQRVLAQYPPIAPKVPAPQPDQTVVSPSAVPDPDDPTLPLPIISRRVRRAGPCNGPALPKHPECPVRLAEVGYGG